LAFTGQPTSVNDNCDLSPAVTYADVINNINPPCSITITRTWRVEDACGNFTTAVQTITVQDNTPPTFTRPPDITIYRDANCNYDASVNATGDVTNEADNCGVGQATFVDAVNNTDPCNVIITRTWSLLDNCGNAAANQVQTITVQDNTPPTFTRPPDITIYRDANCNYDASVNATGDVTNETDNCGVGQATFVDAVNNTDPCNVIITRTWSLLDNCGNAAANQVQTITVQDNTPPTFTRPPDITIYRDANCNYDASVNATGDVTNEADNCGVGQATFVDAVNNTDPCNVIITRTWSLVDNCGNAATNQVQTITVQDNTPPTFTRPTDITIYRDANCSYDASVAATGDVTNEADNCSVGQATYVDNVNSTDPCNVIITRTWSLIDNCGNAAADQVQTITVRDNIPPVITSFPPNQTVSCASQVSPANINLVSATDNCPYAITISVANDVITNQTCPHRYTINRTYTATDICGNATSQSQTITVNDQIPPVITNFPANITVSCASQVPVADINLVSANDLCSGAATITVATDVITNQTCANRYTITRTYTVTDACGNAISQSQIITVNDQIPPVITHCPPNQAFCDVNNSTYVFNPPLIASDNCGTVTISYQVTGATNTPWTAGNGSGGIILNIGNSTIVWRAVDACGQQVTCTTQVTINQRPPAFVGPDHWICIGNSTTIGGAAIPGNTYQWSSSPAGFTSNVSNPTVSPTVTTTYTLRETDPLGCWRERSVVITVYTPPTINTNPTNVQVCNGSQATATFSGTSDGGFPAPTAQWFSSTDGVNFSPVGPSTTSTSGGITTSIYQTTVPNNNQIWYQVTFTNVCGSVTSTAATLTSGNSMNINNGQNNFNSLNLTVCENTPVSMNSVFIAYNNPANFQSFVNAYLQISSTGNPPWQTIWDTTVGFGTGLQFIYANTLTFSNCNQSGYYLQWVIGNYGCNSEHKYTNPITVRCNPVATLTVSNVTCNGFNNGSILLSNIQGTPPYTFAWSTTNGSGLVAGQQNQTTLGPGTYTVTITDAFNCQSVQSATITQPPPLGSSIVPTHLLCNGDNTGAANLTVSGGTPPYSYLWSNSATTEDITNVPAGTYTVTITDNNGCTLVNTVTITEPPVLIASATPTHVACPWDTDGEATLTVTGGTPPYSYLWSNNTTVQNPTGLGIGTYTVTVTDANSCTATASVTIISLDPVVVMPPNGFSTVPCVSLVITPTPPDVYDNCNRLLARTGPVVTDNPDPLVCEGTRIYSYTYTDIANVQYIWTYTYTVEVEDFIANMPPNGGSQVACAADAVQPTPPLVNDYCGNPITPTGPVTGGTYVDCEGTITYTWNYADCEGNNHDWVYTYTVEIEDFIANMPPNAGTTVECASAVTQPLPPAVSDYCGDPITPTGPVVGGTYTNCEGTITYTWNYEDCEGNNHDWVYTYTIDRITPPAEVGGPVPVASTVECIADATPPTLPLVEDVCGNILTAPTPVITYTPDPLTCEGTVEYQYTYTDCANLSYVWTYTYTIEVEDFIANVPVNGSSTVACASLATQPTPPVVNDYCGNPITPTGPITGGTYVDCEGTITYTWNYADCEGNNHDWVYTYTVEVEDFIANMPVNGSSTLACASLALQPIPPAVNDYCGNPITPTGPTTGGTYVDCEGTITYTWNYADCEGNNHDWVYTYTVEVEDFIANMPVNGSSTVACASLATQPTPPAVNDFCGNPITPTGPTTGGTYTNCEGTITYIWNYADCEGNNHDWVYTYTVEVEDFIANMPVNGSSTVACASLATQPTPPVVNDYCGNPITPTGPITGGTYVDCEGTITYTWNYADCEGNNHDWVYTYTVEVEDFIANMPPNAGTTVECASAVTQPLPPAVSDYCGDPITPTGPVVGGTYTNCEGTITYTWNYEDCEGNNHDWVYTYTIDRITPPAEVGGPIPVASTVECIADATPPTLPVVEDVCGNILTPTPASPTMGGTYSGCEGTYTYTYHYIDCSNLTFDWTYTYTIDRVTPPAEVGGPAATSSTVECLSYAVPPTLPVVEDVCGTILSPTTASPTVGGTWNGCDGTYTYTYHYVDCSNLTFNWTYTYTIDRVTPPLISTTAVSGYLGCNPAVTVPVFTGSDICNGPFTPLITTSGPQNTGCNYTQTWTATYTDACNNTAVPVSVTYTWTVDNVAPVIATTATSANLGCNPIITPPVFTVTDLCDPAATPTVTTAGAVNTLGCEYVQSWTATYTNACGNAAVPLTITYSWIVDTDTAILISLDNSGHLGCNPLVIIDPLFLVFDNCDPNPLPTITTTGPLNISGCDYEQSWTASYTDPCGNASTPITITYTWTEDTQAPVISTNVTSGNLGCNPVITDPVFTITDNCDLNPIASVTTTGPINTIGCDYVQSWTANYTDACGNAAVPLTITYSWIVDTDTAILISLDNSGHLGCNPLVIIDPLFLVFDNCDPNPLPAITTTGPLNISGCDYEQSWTASYTDPCGNASTPITITYTWTEDTQAPVISTNVTSGNLGCNPVITDPVFTITDNCDLNPIASVTTTGPINTIGCDYVQSWTANYTDACGNAAVPLTITYSWIVDTDTAILISLDNSGHLGCNPLVIIDPLFLVFDNCDPNPLPAITTTGPLNISGCDYEQSWTASYTDPCGNASTPISITYTWTEDTQAPVIATTDTSGFYGCNPTITAPTFTVTDNCDVNPVANVAITGPTNTAGCTWEQTWTATYTDACNNAAAPVSITYTWTEDLIAPVIATTATSGNLGCNPQIVAPTFTVTDNCDVNPVANVAITGPTNTAGCTWEQTWTATYTDACNNAAAPVSITYTWTEDLIAPVIATTATSGNLGCNPQIVAPTFTVNDNCDVNPVANVAITGPTNTAGCTWEQTWTATYTDACNNAAAPVSITYTWTEDLIAPVIATTATSGNLGCNPQIVAPTFTVNDNCDVNPVANVAITGPTNTAGCTWEQTWTATYTDACNNAAAPVSITYTWTEDLIAPVIATTATSGNLGCNPHHCRAHVHRHRQLRCEPRGQRQHTLAPPTPRDAPGNRPGPPPTPTPANAAAPRFPSPTPGPKTSSLPSSQPPPPPARSDVTRTIVAPTFTVTDNCDVNPVATVATAGPTNTAGCDLRTDLDRHLHRRLQLNVAAPRSPSPTPGPKTSSLPSSQPPPPPATSDVTRRLSRPRSPSTTTAM
jgi:hypothetical protein